MNISAALLADSACFIAASFSAWLVVIIRGTYFSVIYFLIQMIKSSAYFLINSIMVCALIILLFIAATFPAWLVMISLSEALPLV